MAVFWQSGSIPAKNVAFGQRWLYSGKVIVFGPSFCIRDKVGFILGKGGCTPAKWLYSCKSDCTRAKFVLYGQRICIRAKFVLFEQKLLYSVKVFIFGQKWLYSGKSG